MDSLIAFTPGQRSRILSLIRATHFGRTKEAKALADQLFQEVRRVPAPSPQNCQSRDRVQYGANG
jgi:hypothetical protein